MQTIITIQFPLKRMSALKHDWLPWQARWFGWLWSWSGGSVCEFGGSRVNTVRHLELFRWRVLTIRRNEYHDKSHEERAKEYLHKWGECEKELRGLRLLLMGDSTNAEVKKVIRDSMGVDLDEGTIR